MGTLHLSTPLFSPVSKLLLSAFTYNLEEREDEVKNTKEIESCKILIIMSKHQYQLGASSAEIQK